MYITDPKTILRTTRPDGDGRLPILRVALAIGMLDPVSYRVPDEIEEAMSHFDGLADDVHGMMIQMQDPQGRFDQAVAALNDAILQKAGYSGDSESYDDLQNANLFRVMERRMGLPVALGLIYMHVGRAAGFTVDGLGFPGHFMVRIEVDGVRGVLDPFFGGILRDASSLRDLLKATLGQDAELKPLHYDKVDDLAVLLRLQNNIKLRLLQSDNHAAATQVIETMLMMRPDEASLWREAGLLHAHTGNLRAALTALANFMGIETRDDQRAPVEALMADLQNRLN